MNVVLRIKNILIFTSFLIIVLLLFVTAWHQRHSVSDRGSTKKEISILQKEVEKLASGSSSNQADLETIIKTYPNFINELFETSKKQFYDGNPDAIRLLDYIPQERLSVDELAELAYIQAVNANYTKAKALFLYCLEKHPNNTLIRFHYAEMLSWAGEFDEALQQYEILLKKNPNDIQLQRYYARTLLLLGKRDEAQKILKETIKNDK